MEKQIRLLAPAGKSYSGQDSAADLIVRMDQRFVRRSFAGVIKYEFAISRNIPIDKLLNSQYIEDYQLELAKHTAERKKIDPAYFAKILFETIEEDEYTVIDDLKYLEELELCLEKGSAIYKIHADPGRRKVYGWRADSIADLDFSETELDLPSEFFHKVTGGHGGTIYNTRDENYLRDQLIPVLVKSFPLAVGEGYKKMPGLSGIEF